MDFGVQLESALAPRAQALASRSAALGPRGARPDDPVIRRQRRALEQQLVRMVFLELVGGALGPAREQAAHPRVDAADDRLDVGVLRRREPDKAYGARFGLVKHPLRRPGATCA